MRSVSPDAAHEPRPATDAPADTSPAAPPSRLSLLGPLVAVALTMLAWCALWVGALYAIGDWRSRASYLKNYRHPTSAEMRIAMAMEYAEGSTEANDVLLVGDATCESVSVLALQRATGLRVWSLCVAGLVESDGIALLLRGYLAHHPAPRLVVVVRHPHSLLWTQVRRSEGLARSRYDYLRRYDPARRELLLTPSEEVREHLKEGWRHLIGLAFGALQRPLDATVDDCEGGADARVQLGFAVPPEAVLPDVAGRCPGVPVGVVRAAYARNRGGEGGALHATDHTIGALHPDGHQPFAGQRVGSHNDEGVDAIVQQATRRGIPIVLRFTPLRGDAGAWGTAIDVWLAELTARNRGLTVARPHLLQYDPGLFADWMHLNDRGAERFTGQVIEDVRARLGVGPAPNAPAVGP